LDSTDAEAHYSLGLLLAEQQRLADALPYLERAAVRAGHPRYYYNWGLTLQHLGRAAEAEAVYRRALQLVPDSAPNLYALAILYLQQHKPAAARPLIDRLIELDPQNAAYRALERSVNAGS
jgi:tetratricopeptide (TPR) repeat protein